MIRQGHCRTPVNRDLPRIKRMFKWAASKKMAPLAVYQELMTVEGLRAGRAEATETAPVKPVPLATVEATVPHMTPQAARLGASDGPTDRAA